MLNRLRIVFKILILQFFALLMFLNLFSIQSINNSSNIPTDCSFSKAEILNTFNVEDITFEKNQIHLFPEINNFLCLGKINDSRDNSHFYIGFHKILNILINIAFFFIYIFFIINSKNEKRVYLWIVLNSLNFYLYDRYFLTGENISKTVFILLLFIAINEIYLTFSRSTSPHNLIATVTNLLMPIFYLIHVSLNETSINKISLFFIVFTFVVNFTISNLEINFKYLNYYLIVLISFSMNFGSFMKQLEGGHHAFRQSQNAIAARNMARESISIFTPAPFFGTSAKLPFEFPFLQLTSAVLQKLSFLEIFTIRPISWIYFIIFILTFYKIINSQYDKITADYFILFILFHPIVYQYSNAYMIEFLPHLFGIIAINFFYRDRNLVSALFVSFALLAKVTTGFVYLLILLVIYIYKNKFDLIEFFKITFLIVTPNLFWNIYTDNIISNNPSTKWLSRENTVNWVYGTIDQFIDLSYLTTLLQIYLSSFWLTFPSSIFSNFYKGIFICIGLIIYITLARYNKLILLTIIPVVLFKNLFIVHDYYLIAIIPIIIFFIANTLKEHFNLKIGISLLVVLVVMTNLNLVDRSVVKKITDKFEYSNLTQYLMLKEESRNVYLASNYEWNPQYFYEADKQGIMWNPRFAKVGTDLLEETVYKNNIELFIFQIDLLNYQHLNEFFNYSFKNNNKITLEVFESDGESFISLISTSVINTKNIYLVDKVPFNCKIFNEDSEDSLYKNINEIINELNELRKTNKIKIINDCF